MTTITGDLQTASHPAWAQRWGRFLLARAGIAAGMSALFFLVYGSCLAITAMRADVGTCHFEWERRIPFVPWMIVPYLSIDLFFFGSFFLCGSRGELRTHGRRLALAIALAGICFLLFPLRYAFPTPPTAGWAGMLIGWFKGADRPYNLAPSLHIAIRSILWVVYCRHTAGVLRGGLRGWFILIGLSTLLVYQHHVIDVLTGQMLALLCIDLVREPGRRPAGSQPRRDLAIRYGAGAAGCMILAAIVRGWALLAIWPAIAMGILAHAYATGSSDLARKRRGRTPLSSAIVLGPVLMVQRACWWIQGRRTPACARVSDRLWIGRRPGARELAALVESGRSVGLRTAGDVALLDLTAERGRPALPESTAYRNVPVLDLCLPSRVAMERALGWITRRHARGTVYIYCGMGVGRSALVAAAWLLRSAEAQTVVEAIELVRKARPGAVFPPAAAAFLRQYAAAESCSPGQSASFASPRG